MRSRWFVLTPTLTSLGFCGHAPPYCSVRRKQAHQSFFYGCVGRAAQASTLWCHEAPISNLHLRDKRRPPTIRSQENTEQNIFPVVHFALFSPPFPAVRVVLLSSSSVRPSRPSLCALKHSSWLWWSPSSSPSLSRNDCGRADPRAALHGCQVGVVVERRAEAKTGQKRSEQRQQRLPPSGVFACPLVWCALCCVLCAVWCAVCCFRALR